MAQRKRIDTQKAQEALDHLDEIPAPIISARRFIIENFDRLEQSKKSLFDLHQFFMERGIHVGSFSYFRDVYNSEKRSRKLAAAIVSSASSKSESKNTALSEKVPMPKPEKVTSPVDSVTSVPIATATPLKHTSETEKISSEEDDQSKMGKRKSNEEIWCSFDTFTLQKTRVSGETLYFTDTYGAGRMLFLTAEEVEKFLEYKRQKEEDLNRRRQAFQKQAQGK